MQECITGNKSDGSQHSAKGLSCKAKMALAAVRRGDQLLWRHAHTRGSQARASDTEGPGEAAPAARPLVDVLHQRRNARAGALVAALQSYCSCIYIAKYFICLARSPNKTLDFITIRCSARRIGQRPGWVHKSNRIVGPLSRFYSWCS